MILQYERRLFHILSAMACLLLAIFPSAYAQQADNPPPINPTSRTLEMAVPLHYGKYYLGDLELRITPDQLVLVPKAQLLTAVKPLLREEAFGTLNKLVTESADAENYADLAVIHAGGFDFTFNPAAVSVIFAPTFEQKVEGNISVQARRALRSSPNAVDPAKLAAFLNMRMATDYIGISPNGREGLTAPRLDLEMAARWQGVVVEGEATFEPDDTSIFGKAGQGFKRRGTRLIRDYEEDALRFSAGDIYPPGTALQNTPDMLGISLERSYGKLQPGRNIRPTSRRSFRIERPSNVDVEVNGVVERRLKLDPGDYNLSDLPVRTGLNEITLLIEDDAGGRERLEFSVFRDGDLLAQNLSEWALSAGLLSSFDEGEPDYNGGAYFATGYYRSGITENLTAEGHLQASPNYGLGGLSLLYGTSAGLIALDGATSVTDSESWGATIEAYYSPPVMTDSGGRNHSVRLSLQSQTKDFTGSLPRSDTPGALTGTAYDQWLDLSASYRTDLPFRISTFLSGGYGFGFEGAEDRIYADLGLSRSFGHELSLGVAAGYSGAYDEEDNGDFNFQLRLHYRPDADTAYGLSYDPAGHRTRASYHRRSGQGIGSWQLSGEISHDAADTDDFDPLQSDYTLDAAVQYTGNRGQIALYQQSGLAGIDADSIDQRTSLRIETAIAYADGLVAFGRPVADGFAIVTPYAGLAGHEVAIGKEQTGIIARSDAFGPALIPSVTPYALSRIDYDVADLPVGYDLGEGLFDLQPQYRSGYALKVGSAYTVTAIGTLHGMNGEPLALLTGVAIEKANPDKKVELFTNRTGRFAAQGLSPGSWILEMASNPPQRFMLNIPEGSVGLVRAGEVPPLAVRETP